MPRGLEDVSKYPELFAELLRSGQWTVQELKNLAGLNMLRVMRQVEKVTYEWKIALVFFIGTLFRRLVFLSSGWMGYLCRHFPDA